MINDCVLYNGGSSLDRRTDKVNSYYVKYKHSYMGS